MPNIRKSNSEHIAAGTYRPDRHAPKEPVKVTDPLPDAPDWLDDVARVEWYRIVSAMKDGQVYKAPDLAALAVYCSLFAEIRVTGVQSVQTSRLAFFRQLCNDLGLTPQSRAKFDPTTPEDKVPPGHERADFDDI